MAHPQHITPALLPDGEIRPVVRAPGTERWSWALYDFANTIFSMNIATLYFSVWIVADLGSTDLVYAVAIAAASVLMVVAITVFWARCGRRLRRFDCWRRNGSAVFHGRAADDWKVERRRDRHAPHNHTIHGERWTRIYLRADRRIVSHFLIAVVPFLPRSQSRATRRSGQLAEGVSRRLGDDYGFTVPSWRFALPPYIALL